MSVSGALVGSDGNDLRVGRVRDVVDGQGILVVAVADIAAQVLRIRTLVLEALGLRHPLVIHLPRRARVPKGP